LAATALLGTPVRVDHVGISAKFLASEN